METDDLIKNASNKLKRKNADYICANQLNDSNTGFESDTNTITLLGKSGLQKSFSGPKTEIASDILNTIFSKG
jgi:phosphopantothenoylcysteine decarboxylase/phosphopantothenate--cysteine ligase